MFAKMASEMLLDLVKHAHLLIVQNAQLQKLHALNALLDTTSILLVKLAQILRH